MNVKEINVFLYQNFELKHVTTVTDFRCLEKLGAVLLLKSIIENLHFLVLPPISIFVVVYL